jgi:hypothetical protein
MIYHILPVGCSRGSIRSAEYGTTGIDYNEIIGARTITKYNKPEKGYIFYQPGDVHYSDILNNSFIGLWVRIGDLHHLQNPLINTIGFIVDTYKNIERVSLNTNPAFAPLFDYLFPGCNALPISELTIQAGLLEESAIVVPNKQIRRCNGRAAYIGPIDSAFHPRRTDWIHRLINSEDGYRVDIYPTLNPTDWLNYCSHYNTILAPSLNSQWSHNIFVPNLGGSRIVTDCQSWPSFNYYTNYKTRCYRSCLFTGSFTAFRSAIRIATEPHYLETGAIAENARHFMETKDHTLAEFFKPDRNNSSIQRISLLEKDTVSYSYILTAANIFEIVQEIIRLVVFYDRFLLSCQSAILFRALSTYFPHPRLIVKHEPNAVGDLTHRSCVDLMGLSNETRPRDLLLKLDVVLNPNDELLMRLSSRVFEPCRLSIYEKLRNFMSSSIRSDYRPAEFPQKLLNSVTVNYL